jgi:hypothetical protein
VRPRRKRRRPRTRRRCQCTATHRPRTRARTQPRSSLAIAAVADAPPPTDAAPVAVSSPAAAACTHLRCRPAAAAAPHHRPHLRGCAACGGGGCGSTWLGVPNSRRDKGRWALGELQTGLWAPNWAAICCWADGGCCLRSVVNSRWPLLSYAADTKVRFLRFLGSVGSQNRRGDRPPNFSNIKTETETENRKNRHFGSVRFGSIRLGFRLKYAQADPQAARHGWIHLTADSRWEWAGPDLALDLAPWPQGQFARPQADPNFPRPLASLAQWVPWGRPKNIITLFVIIHLNK